MHVNGCGWARRLLAWLAAVPAVALCGTWLAVGGASGARSSSTLLATFATPGTYSWTVPTGITKIAFDVFGAAGGNVSDGSTLMAVGGGGGEAKGHFTVKPGQTFEIVVGGRGVGNAGTLGGPGGFNGGGFGGDGSSLGGGGGGGGSDVRIGGSGNPCVSDKSCSESDRIVVGGGGGGAYQSSGANGGAGGGLVGADGLSGGGQGGQQENHNPGYRCRPDGPAGCFGYGGFDNSANGNGGGGGGWYGGDSSFYGLSGGGGSGFVSPFARDRSFPGGTQGPDGLVKISTP
jgi:hypothetical protein